MTAQGRELLDQYWGAVRGQVLEVWRGSWLVNQLPAAEGRLPTVGRFILAVELDLAEQFKLQDKQFVAELAGRLGMTVEEFERELVLATLRIEGIEELP